MPLTCWNDEQLVKLDPVKSAEPPTNSGNIGASAAIAFCEALRVANTSAFSFTDLIMASVDAFQFFGRSPFMRRLNSAAKSGNSFS